LLVLCLGLFLVAGAQAQNYIYTFYDGPNGTGKVMATYTGPLVLVDQYVPTTGVVLYPANLGGTIPPTVSPTRLQPCNTVAWVYPEFSGIFCFSPGFGQGILEVLFSGPNPTTPGTYNLLSAYGGPGDIQTFDSSNNPTGVSNPILSFTIALAPPPIPKYSCAGFQDPFDQALSLKQKVQRAIPLKIQLLDSNGNAMTDSMIPAPVVNISYTAKDSVAVDDTADLDAVGHSSVGNLFSYDPTTLTWQFNLSSSPFTALGTYTVTVNSGDASQYLVSPTCTGTFVRK
jgi:hypothetical protein